MTREEAVKKAQIIDFLGVHTIELINQIYDDFEKELKQAYIDGSNANDEAMKKAGKLK